MPIPSLITDLSATISANSPAGGEPPGQGDDHLRAHAGFIRQLYDSDASNLAKLANAASATDGLSLLGYNPALAYGGGAGQFLNYTFGRTASEIANSVTPTAYQYFPGDIRRYGAVSGGAAATNVTAIQNAINAKHRVVIPNGTYAVNASIDLLDYTYLDFESRSASIVGTVAGPIFRGKNGTTERRFRITINSGTISNTTRATAGGIAIDFLSVTFGKVFNTEILESETAVRVGGTSSQGAFYNEFHAVDISGYVTAYDLGTLGNATGIFGGRVNDGVTSVRDNNNTGTFVSGTSLETFTGRAILNADVAATQGSQYYPSRVENGPTGIDIRADAQFCRYDLPLVITVATPVIDASTTKDTNGQTDNGLVLKSGKPLKKIDSASAVIDFPSIAANSSTDIAIALPGAANSDLVSACCDQNLEAGLSVIGVPSVNQIYVRVINSTTAAINPASHTYTVGYMRF